MSSLAAGPSLEALRRGVPAPVRPRALPPPATVHLLLLVNPQASGAADAHRARILRSLESAFTVTTVLTEGRGHATHIARDAAGSGYDLVAVLGGDGTLSEAAHGLAGSQTPLTCLPAGLTNVFARSVGTPAAPIAAERLAARVDDLDPRTVDLGVVNGRHFLFTSGVGLSGSLMGIADAAPERKARFGLMHFYWTAASLLARRYVRNPPRMRVEAADRWSDGITLVVQNSDPLTYFGRREIRACEAAGPNTGTISLTMLKRARPRDVFSVLPRLLSGSAASVVDHREIEGFAAIPHARVTALDGIALPVEADGEYLGEHHEIEYRAAPGALRIVA